MVSILCPCAVLYQPGQPVPSAVHVINLPRGHLADRAAKINALVDRIQGHVWT
jgi:hypothetical protein